MLPSHIPMKCRNRVYAKELLLTTDLIAIRAETANILCRNLLGGLPFAVISLGSKDSGNSQYIIVSMRHHVLKFGVFLVVILVI